jgi:hypothetical protein
MDNVSGLVGIPPAQVINRNADFFQRPLCFLDLNLKSAVREQEWTGMINQNLHKPRNETRR